MPYTVKNPPTRIKGLPVHAIEIWVAAFNSALTQYKNEGKANAVAWAAIKTKYKKVGDKWVAKKTASEVMLNKKIISSIKIEGLQFGEGKKTTIQVLPFGLWKHPLYGKIKIKESEMTEFIKNFDNGIRKDLPITEGHSVGEEEKPAIGWFRELVNKGRDGLWAVIEWTEQGKSLLQEKAYKYFSPEFYSTYEDPETHKIYTNVLVGGALTNRPYFKGLQAVMLSEFTFDENMLELKDIITKDASELSDDEKNFLKENKEELSDDQKETYKDVLAEDKDEGGDDDDKGDDDEDKDKDEDKNDDEGDEDKDKDENKDEDKSKVEGSEKVMIDGKTLKMLERNAQEGVQAAAELRTQKAEGYVEKLTFSETNKNGTVLPKSRDKVVKFLLSLSEKQQTAFKAILAELPKSAVFSELGKGDGMPIKASEQVQELTKGKMDKDKELSYRQALEQVFAENPELSEQVEGE